MSDLIALLDATLRLISNNGTDKKNLSKLPLSGVKPGGYPIDMFLDGLSQNEKETYQCGICFLIVKNACHCLNKHQFCRSCVTVWAGSGDSDNHKQCPVCRAKGYYLPSGRVADSLNSKTVCCFLRSCVWTGQLRDMQYHRHIFSKKIAEEGQPRIRRKNSDSSDDCSESDSDRESRTPSPSSSPVLPRIVTNPGLTSSTSSLCYSQQEREETTSSPSYTTFLQMLRSASSASSSVDVIPRRNAPTTRSVVSTTATTTNAVVPASAEVTPVVRCCTPRPQSPTPPTPATRIPPQVSAVATTTPATRIPTQVSAVATTTPATRITPQVSAVATTTPATRIPTQVSAVATTTPATRIPSQFSAVATTTPAIRIPPRVSAVATTTPAIRIPPRVSAVATTTPAIRIPPRVSAVATTTPATRIPTQVSPVATTTPAIRMPPQVSPVATTTPNNTTAITAGFPVRHAVLPSIQSTDSENNTTSSAPGQQVANHCCSTGCRSGPKEYERLRARMRETRVRLEQMEITRRELARFQERQRLQHLVEVRELGRQLNEVTFQIRRLLSQMSTTDDQNTTPTAADTTTTTTNNNHHHHHHHHYHRQ